MTGITLASNLDPEKFEIQILDKGRGVGGRMASKTIFVDTKNSDMTMVPNSLL